MPITNFPNGVSSFGLPVLGGLPLVPAGKIFWVNYTTGTNAAGRGDSPDNPLKTLDYAIGLTRANKGDIILLMPGHAEDVIAAGTVTVDVAGINIVGLGQGTNRPTFTFKTATTATWVMSAANCRVSNIYFDLTGIDNLVKALDISGAWNTVENCEFLMATSTPTGADAAIVPTAAATGLRVLNNIFNAQPGAASVAAIYTAAAVSRMEIGNNLFLGDFSVAAINNVTAAVTLVNIHDNVYYGTNASEPMVELLTGSTGMIYRNFSGVSTMSAAGSIVADACYKFENYITDTAANSAILDPTGVTL